METPTQPQVITGIKSKDAAVEYLYKAIELAKAEDYETALEMADAGVYALHTARLGH